MATASTRAEVFYPESDGEPMGETIQHRDATIDLILALKDWFVDDPLAYVSGDEFLYYVEGDPRSVVSPDVWCALGIAKAIPRPSYKTWLEAGKGPDLVVELTSKSTRRVDQGKKFRIYQDDLKVREYFLFDPLGEYLKPPLQGHRLIQGAYRPIEPVAGRLPSEILGLHLEAENGFVRLFDPAAGERLLNREERLELLDAQIQAMETANRMHGQESREKDAIIRAQLATTRKQADAIQAQNAAIRAQEVANRIIQDENDRLRGELEALRAASRPKPKPKRK